MRKPTLIPAVANVDTEDEPQEIDEEAAYGARKRAQNPQFEDDGVCEKFMESIVCDALHVRLETGFVNVSYSQKTTKFGLF